MTTSLPHMNITTLLDEDAHLMEMKVSQLGLIQQQTAGWDKKQFLEEILILKSRIKRLEDRTLEQHDGPTDQAEETSSPPTSSQEPQLPQQDPNEFVVEYSIPEWVVDILMARTGRQDFIMSCLGSICYPAKLWFPCRVTHNRSPVRELLLRGWTRQAVDDAKVAIYNFLIEVIRENILSLHPDPSQQNIWETWNRSKHEQLHQTTPSENDDSQHDPHTNEDTQSRHEGARWGQLNRIYNDFHDNGNNAAITTLIMSDDEDDLAAILDLPLIKPEGMDIMDDGSEVTNAMTKIDMTGDLIVMHEDVTTANMQGLHTGVKKEDIFAKKEPPANNTNLYDGKHETHQVARCDEMHVDEDTKYMTNSKQSEAYEVACKIDVTIKTNQKEVKNVKDQRGTEMLADNTYQQAMNETYQEEYVDKTYQEINIENISIMRVS